MDITMETSSESGSDDECNIIDSMSLNDQQVVFSEVPSNVSHEEETSRNRYTSKGIQELEIEVPSIGKEFDSTDQAYDFYNLYARKKGFSIRKQRIERTRKGIVRLKRFVCSKEGYRRVDSHTQHVKKSRAITRTGCQARMVLKLTNNEMWLVTELECKHNHPLVPEGKAFLLRSQRVVERAHSIQIAAMDNSGISPTEGYDFLCEQAGGYQNLNFTKDDYKYQLRMKRTGELKDGDIKVVLEYLENKHLEDPMFYHSVQVDQEDKMTNFFWVDARSVQDYVCFGDVVCFDATYKTNKYGRPFAPFVGHIYLNAGKNLSGAYTKRFKKRFKSVIYGSENEEEFISDWNVLLIEFNLEENTWLLNLFDIREKLALVYGRGSFCANMTTTQRNESTNIFLKRYLKRKYTIIRFLKRYDKAMERRRLNELTEDFNSNQTFPILWANVPILKQAAKEYTRTIYAIFEEEYKRWIASDCDILEEEGSNCMYKVTGVYKNSERLVTFDSSKNTFVCSCKKFEFMGIQCRHVVKVLNHRKMHTLPPQYMLKRWTKSAKIGIVNNNYGGVFQDNGKAIIGSRYGNMCHQSVRLATKVANSEKATLIVTEELRELHEKVDKILSEETQPKPQTNALVRGNPMCQQESTSFMSQLMSYGFPFDSCAGLQFQQALEIPLDQHKKQHSSAPIDSCLEK
ncbi:protein FAR1-RELATED SEQUENCE 1-like [Macadamia integrifolia]|uniref:protein FAR1-RELATED SEQUENCE 1-like n=1 Tax=Macadamia integrifolia TaxID=60698 RepID=UPI001C52D3E4|nr:protein FAR1-RELATED SEQUENCE 1-like [Macadamia integrifolia]